MPELQGRLPIRVELRPLTEDDFIRILTETDNALTRQYASPMETEGVTVEFEDSGIREIAKIAASVNQSVENIGARRLYTVMERIFEELSFSALSNLAKHLLWTRHLCSKTLVNLAVMRT